MSTILTDDERPKLPTLVNVETLKKMISHDPKTGDLKWLCGRRRPAGSLTRGGYIYLYIGNRRHPAHRVCWALFYGAWPDGQIDHINGARADNRIENLRVVDPKGNRENQTVVKTGNRTGFLGVYPRNGRFVAQIQTNRRNRYIGTFDTAELAHAAYVEQKRIIHPMGTL